MKYHCKAKNNLNEEISLEFEVQYPDFAKGTAMEAVAHYNKENKLTGTTREFYFMGCEAKK